MIFIGLIAFGFTLSDLVYGETSLWSEGSFTLPASKDGCPSDDFVKVHIVVRLPISAQSSNGHQKDWIKERMRWQKKHGHLDSVTLSDELNDHLEVLVGFCVRSNGQDSMEYMTSHESNSHYVSEEDPRQEWPSGKYCVLKTMHRQCPQGLINGTREVLYPFIHEDGDRYHEDEALPSIRRERNISILEYCCAVNGNTSEYMILPSSEPFLLFPLDGKRCQKVKDMNVFHEAIAWSVAEDTSLKIRDIKPVGYVDYLDKNRQIAMHFCYYVPINQTRHDLSPRVYEVEEVTNGTDLSVDISLEPSPPKPSKRYMLYYIIPSIALVVLVVFLCALHSIRRNKRHTDRNNSQGSGLISSKDNCFQREGKIVCNEYMQTDQDNPESNLSCLLNALLDEETKARLQRVLIPISFLTIEESIGQGAFGKVFKGKYSQDQGKEETVAVKCIKGPMLVK